MIAGFIFLVIILAILGLTTWLAIRQFKTLGTRIDASNTTLNTSMSNLNSNVTKNYLLRGDFATASNQFTSSLASVNSSLDKQSHSLLSQSKLINNLVVAEEADDTRWNQYFHTGINPTDNKPMTVLGVDALATKVGILGGKAVYGANIGIFPDFTNLLGGSSNEDMLPFGGMTIDPTDGALRVQGSQSNDIVRMKAAEMQNLSLGTSKKGEQLNVAGKLNFASTNSSYMLGVDGTQMYLKMADEQDSKLQLRTPNNTPIVTIDGRTSQTQVEGDIALKGCIKQAGAGGSSASMCFDNNTLSLNGASIRAPQLSIGQYTLKENASGHLVVQKGATDVAVLSPDISANTLTLRNTAGGSHTLMAAGSSNLSLIP
jgi:hypothetical protein